MIQQLLQLIVGMRPRQWLKNGLLFGGLIFAELANQFVLAFNALQAFVVFCLLSGAVYLFNDLIDLEPDRRHPKKRLRPLASGKLRSDVAGGVCGALVLLALIWSFQITRAFGWCAVAYVAMSLSYTLWLKRVVIVDLLILALGFVLRAYAGIAAINLSAAELAALELPSTEPVRATPWFLACTLFLALFIAICKRRHELDLLQESANQHREVLEEYSKPFLDQMVAVATTSTVLTYALYAIDQEPPNGPHSGVIYTLPFVLYGVFRYLYLVYHKKRGGTPESTVLGDPTLIANILAWLAAMVYIFYY